MQFNVQANVVNIMRTKCSLATFSQHACRIRSGKLRRQAGLEEMENLRKKLTPFQIYCYHGMVIWRDIRPILFYK